VSLAPPRISSAAPVAGCSPAQSQHPRRSTNRPACGRRQPYGRRHRTASVWTRISSTVLFYGWFGAEARISIALACPRINRWRPPRSMGAGDLARAAVCACPSESPRLTFKHLPGCPNGRRACRPFRQVKSAHLGPVSSAPLVCQFVGRDLSVRKRHRARSLGGFSTQSVGGLGQFPLYGPQREFYSRCVGKSI